MRQGDRFPDDQAYISFNDAFVESLEELTEQQRVDIIAEVIRLCENPSGNHPLSNRNGQNLAGWNTVDVLNKQYRVVFVSRVEEVAGRSVGTIEVLVAGPRRNDAVYDMASMLVKTGRITEDEMTEVWESLALLETVAEDVGLDGWDYRPEPAPEGLVKSAVAAGLLDEDTAVALSKDEINAAMEEGWGVDGKPDSLSALAAALRRARGGIDAVDVTRVVKDRHEPRCDAVMKRTEKRCIRRKRHPGAHRSTV